MGSIYAMMGVVYNVMFSASRVMSFTTGQLGMLGGVLGAAFVGILGLPAIVGLVLTLACCALVGIVTERDFLRRVIADQRDPSETSVSEIMTRSILTCTPDTRLEEVRATMRDRRVRHMPVIDAGRLVGMISIGDLNFAESQSLTQQVEQLEMYIRTA